MVATNPLRWVNRSFVHSVQGDGTEIHSFKQVLQQWWERNDLVNGKLIGEWRDVPIETEA